MQYSRCGDNTGGCRGGGAVSAWSNSVAFFGGDIRNSTGNALIQWNSVSMWIAFCFIVPSAVSFACRAGAVSYAAIYPVYIALPGIACLGTMIISREFARLIKAALIFLVAGAVFLLETCGILSIGWTLAVLFVYLAALAAAFIVYLNKGEKK